MVLLRFMDDSKERRTVARDISFRDRIVQCSSGLLRWNFSPVKIYCAVHNPDRSGLVSVRGVPGAARRASRGSVWDGILARDVTVT